MITYRTDNGTFSLSYQELRETHAEMCALSDEEFLRSLPAALHLACIISWLKELGPDATIGDQGIVHELVHLLHSGTTATVAEVREQFRVMLALA